MNVCFAITINDGPVVIAGGPLVDVLSTMLTHVRERGELELRVSGLVSRADHDNEHIDWLHQSLSVGDRVTITVVDDAEASAPIGRERSDPGGAEREERRYYERLKQKYETG
jgi:hypothetical protein